MGLIDAVLGNAQGVDLNEAGELVGPLLTAGEGVTHAFVVGLRDMLLFTPKRLICVDRQGVSGKRMTIVAYPWRNVLSWSVYTAGTLDIDSELVINALGMQIPLLVKFPRRTDTRPVAQAIAQYVLT